jgi:hypothetical protein
LYYSLIFGLLRISIGLSVFRFIANKYKRITICSLSTIRNIRSGIQWAKPKVILNYSTLPNKYIYTCIHRYIYTYIHIWYTFKQIHVKPLNTDVYIYTYTHIPMHKYIFIYAYTNVNIYICMFIYVCVCIYVCVSIYIHVYMFVCVCVCLCINLYTCINEYICVYMCSYIYTTCRIFFSEVKQTLLLFWETSLLHIWAIKILMLVWLSQKI